MAARAPLVSRASTRISLKSSRWTRPASLNISRRSFPCSRCPSTAVIGIRTFTNSISSREKKYTKDHEWIEVGEDGSSGTIGVSEYAAKALGDVVYVELPQVQDELSAGDTLGAVESVKSASDIMTPVGGTVLETNQLLGDVPGTINKSPEGDGWIAKMKLSNPAEVDKLMDADQYANHTGEQELKDE